MNRWLNHANKRLSLSAAAMLLIGATLFGQILGFLRVTVINGSFPATGPSSTDAYFAAFQIPDLFFFTLSAGALGVAFMPFLADKLEHGDKKALWKLTSSLLNLLSMIMVIIGLLIAIFAEPLITHIISNKLSPQQLSNAATIMRLVALNPLIFTISGILTSVQQTYGRFFFFAVGPIVYNLSIIASAYIFRDNIGIVGLGIGALAGAILQLLVVCLGLFGLGFRYYPVIDFANLDFRRVLKQLPARSIDQGIDSINSIVETNRARNLGEGNISYYANAYTLHMVPIALIGTTIATAAFPRFITRIAQGRSDLFKRDFLQVLRAMIWIIIPIAVISFFARGYLARLIFKRDAPDIALIFGFLAGAIFFRTLYMIISRYFYARKDTITPLLVSLFAIALNIILVFNMAKPQLEGGYGISGLALAQSIVAAAEVAILVIIMIWRDRSLFNAEFMAGLFKILSVTGFVVLTAFIMVNIVPLSRVDRGFITLGSKLFFIITPTLLVHFALSSLFGLEEVKPVTAKLRKLILKPVKIQ